MSHAALSTDIDSAEAVNMKNSPHPLKHAWQILPYIDRFVRTHLAEQPKMSCLLKEVAADLTLKIAAGFRPTHWCSMTLSFASMLERP